MRFVIPGLSVSNSNSNMPIESCRCGFVTTESESVRKCSAMGVKDTGA